MNGDFSALLSSGFIPGWLGISLIAIWYLRTRAANRTADASIKDGEWKRLIEWNQRLQDDCEACHRERDEWRSRAVAAEARAGEAEARELKWKAIAEGIGQNRQEEAALLAAERLAEQGEREK